jgi:hypothetical protein
MERIVDLDLAAAEIERRRAQWTAAGLTVGPLTWRDELTRWPRPLETARERVRDPDSVGVVLGGAGVAEARVVLFRGGWADVDFVPVDERWGVVAECPHPRSAADFGAVLDSLTLRVFTPRPRRRPWQLSDLAGGPLDALLAQVRKTLPGVVVERLTAPSPADDDNVYWLSVGLPLDRVQLDTAAHGRPPFTVEWDGRRLATSDPAQAAAAVIAGLGSPGAG